MRKIMGYIQILFRVAKKVFAELVLPALRAQEFWERYRVRSAGLASPLLSFYVFFYLMSAISPRQDAPFITPTDIIGNLVIMLGVSFIVGVRDFFYKKEDKEKELKYDYWMAVNLNPIMVFIYWPIHWAYALINKKQRKRIADKIQAFWHPKETPS